jgi:hypothetical protein
MIAWLHIGRALMLCWIISALDLLAHALSSNPPDHSCQEFIEQLSSLQ